MVIANAGLIRNCLLLCVKGMSESLGDNSILGSHTCETVMISASIRRGEVKAVTMSLVPLARPLNLLMFLRSMMWQPTFQLELMRGYAVWSQCI